MALISVTINRPVRSPGTSRRRRRGALGVLAIGLVWAGVGGIAGASPGGGALDDTSIVPITPHVVASNVSIAAHKSVLYTAIGGTTTVPTNATRVELAVTALGISQPGNLGISPAGSATTGVTLFYQSGAVENPTTNVVVAIGLKNQISVFNFGAGAVRVTVKIIGYSTAVNASDIDPSGGNPGDVLANTGTGAAWHNIGHVYRDGGAVLGRPTNQSTPIAHVNVPAGDYYISFQGMLFGSGSAGNPDDFFCGIDTPRGGSGYLNYTVSPGVAVAQQDVVSLPDGGNIAFRCTSSTAGDSVSGQLVALSVYLDH
jgi:hypothetical protein